MRLPSIAERLEERFLRPLEVDQLCALVQPAIEELRIAVAPEPVRRAGGAGAAPPRRPGAFRRLEEGIAKFTREISGAGFDLPVLAGGLAAGGGSGPVAGRRGGGDARSRTARPASPALPGGSAASGPDDPRRLTAVVLYWRISRKP